MQAIWNEKAKQQFRSYISHNQSQQKPVFLILIGPEGIWKTTFLRSFVEELLWEQFKTDFLRLRDFSKELGKLHSIQVETPKEAKTIAIDEKTTYENRGVRELTNRLQQSSFSGKKVLLVQNIQRMTNAAMNAFLKTCEEPLPNRYLFATAEHESWILPTILSRAMVIRFAPLSDTEMQQYLVQVLGESESLEKTQLLAKIALGRPWILQTILEKQAEKPEILTEISQLLKIIQHPGLLASKMNLLKRMDEEWILDTILSAIIKIAIDANKEQSAEVRIKVKQLIWANVSKENALRYWILSDV